MRKKKERGKGGDKREREREKDAGWERIKGEGRRRVGGGGEG